MRALALLIVLLPNVATAQTTQGFALERFDPAERGSDWFELESLDLRGSLRPAAGLTLDYAHNPLVFYDKNGKIVSALVANQLIAHLGGAFTMWERVRFGLDIPVALYENGTGGATADGTFRPPGTVNFGDVRIGADVRLFGNYGDLITLGAGLQIALPTGTPSGFVGDGRVRLIPRLLGAGKFKWLEYAAKITANIRTITRTFAGTPVGPELAFGAAIGARILDKKLLLGPELTFESTLTGGEFFQAKTTPFEILFGGHYTFLQDFRAGLGIGPGLSHGYGTPDVRVVASFDWAPAIKKAPPAKAKPPPPPPPPKPKKVEPPPPDRDGDGIPDAEDACPDMKGLRNADPKKNGCPSDRDGDTIPDIFDACPDAAGPPNLDVTKNGCPVARVEKKEIKSLDQIKFETNSATILPESDHIVEAVAQTLKDNPQIKRLSIEGHTDNVGSAPYNKSLSQNRAASVVTWLVKRGGIDKGRLESHGYGKERPIDSNSTERGRYNNRRVEFHIIGE